MTVMLVLIDLALLLLEGWLLARLLLRVPDRLLCLALALPLAAVSNVLLFFTFTVTAIPLAPLTLGIGHGVVIGILGVCHHLRHPPQPDVQSTWEPHPGLRPMRIICLILLTNIAIYSGTHALFLPTISIDSLTNWTMRSQISFVDRHMAFDPTEERGMSKPQYPFLTHALQIAANQGQGQWNDRAANAVTWLLSLSSFTALFLLLQKLRGTDIALLALTPILGLPLLSIHLAQGYGDIHLVAYLLLALATFPFSFKREQAFRPAAGLMLSAVFILGAMWTKSEGLVFGFAPWALLVLINDFSVHRSVSKSEARSPKPYCTVLATLALFLPFPLLLLVQGLPLTPHASDAAIAWHPEGLSALLPSVFASGSFGIIWYALIIASIVAVLALRRCASDPHRSALLLLLWGWLIVVENLFIYLFTPNVVFLVNGESFFRQMLPAAALIILACALIVRPLPSVRPVHRSLREGGSPKSL